VKLNLDKGPAGSKQARLVRKLKQLFTSFRFRLLPAVRSALARGGEAERQSADSALRASEMRYRRLFETAQDGILILNAQTGQIDDVNPFLTRLLGYTREQFLGNKLWEIGPFKDSKASKAAFEELQRAGYVRYEDLPLETSDGRAIHVEFVSAVYEVSGRKVIQCNIHDVTKRKHLEAERAKLAAIVDSSDDAIIGNDLNDIIITWNAAAERLFGYRSAEVVGQPINFVIPPDLQPEELIILDRLRHDEPLDHFETVRVARDGRRIPISVTLSPIRDAAGAIIGASTIARDITDRKQAEAKRAEQDRELLVLSRRLVWAQETERRNIARELHDEIGQSLTVTELLLQALLALPGNQAMVSRLRESLQVVERVQEQVHDLSLNLRPSMLDDLGLEATLRWCANRQAALVGLQFEVRVDPLEHRLDPVIETECFRVAQEALNNVVKHAKAHTVIVELTRNDEQLHLSVRDDGIGFDVASVREQAVRGISLGLLSMEERSARAGGGLRYHAIPGQGTEVHAWFPLKWAPLPNEPREDGRQDMLHRQT
jgi:PAS domain S-box-containing protein